MSDARFAGRLLNLDPLIFYSQQIEGAHSFIRDIGPALAGVPAIALFLVAWSAESAYSAERQVKTCEEYRIKYPEHRLIILCNTEAEVSSIHAAGGEAFFANHNTFVDFNLFKIEHLPKVYDAIYVAQLREWKRQELARLIDSIAFIYYGFDEEQVEYYNRLKEMFPHGHFINHELNNLIRLPKEIVRTEVNKAKCGLCLSAAEGAMHASIEYLLCGVPVVSTVNRGGRDLFFDDQYCLTVEPDPQIIANAVQEVVARNVPREEIREKTISIQMRERERFIQFIDRLIEETGKRSDFRARWPEVFVDKLIQIKSADELIAISRR
jgi:glycosyltransferase involved in cell wall biosynthesis